MKLLKELFLNVSTSAQIESNYWAAAKGGAQKGMQFFELRLFGLVCVCELFCVFWVPFQRA